MSGEENNEETAAVSASSAQHGNQEGGKEEDTAAAAAPGLEQQQQQPTRAESFFAMTKSLILRALIIYFISSFFRRPQPPQPNSQSAGGGTNQPESPRTAAWNYFENGTMFDLHVYLSENPDVPDFDTNLVWLQEGLIYGDWYGGFSGDGTFSQYMKFKASKSLMNNGSIYIHTFVTKYGQSPDPTNEFYGKKYVAHSVKQLNKHKKILAKRNFNLLTNEKEEAFANPEAMKDVIVSHWHPNITINIVVDQTNWQQGAIPSPIDEFVHFVDSGKTYLPILFINDFWNLLRDYQPINDTTPELELTVTFQPISMFKWQLYAAQSMKNKWNGNMFGELMSGGAEDTDEGQDSLKETLLETNIYLLAATIVVSILHSVFELLAFKNDIQFWNNRKSLEGLSVRSVFFGVAQSLIVLLYVMDNETNFMIKMSCFVGLGIEVWKIHKVVDIKLDKERKILGVLPRIGFTDKGSYVESSTKEYDNLAFKYLGWLCFPLFFGYFIYSLIYNEHKGWYSFVLNMLYGYLLTFGFIMMTPQLFINYKMKSVAHMPWRMMSYKFLNTFIDDIFAFVIKMPTMYRLGCFRDDIIFFIFLYQRWMYKVDHKRVNEFGFSKEMEEEALLKKNSGAGGAILDADKPKSAEAKKED